MIPLNPKYLDDDAEVPEFSSDEDYSPGSKGTNKDLIQFESDEDKPNRIMLGQVSQEGRMGTGEIMNTVYEVEKCVKEGSVATKGGSILKALVSKEKQRYNLDGFDLDLTYVTDRLIAFGFPAENMESIYRNSMEDVKSFFNLRHSNQYMILNLCSERKYKHTHFQGMVKEFPFDDHQAPPFRLIFEACQFMDEWIKKKEDNIVGVHCKAGKGRTGVICCCYLLYTEQFKTAKDALKYYGLIRTKDRKGVTIPSQIRYVEYFELAMKSKWRIHTFPRQQIELDQIIFSVSPNVNLRGGCGEPHFRLQFEDKVFYSKDHFPIQSYKQGQQVVFKDLELILEGDILIEFCNNSVLKQEKLFQFWFNTTFIRFWEDNVFRKNQLDKAVRDKEHKRFPENFTLTLIAKPPSPVRRRSQPLFLNVATQKA